MKKVYKASNAKHAKASLSKTDKSKVSHSRSLSVLSSAHSGPRQKLNTPATMKPPAVKMSSFPPLDSTLTDFGCSGNFFSNKNTFDSYSFVTTPSTMVQLPDSRGVTGGGTDLFCGQPAHYTYLPNFDKSLLCSEFFNDKNYAVLYLDDDLFIFRLDQYFKVLFIDTKN